LCKNLESDVLTTFGSKRAYWPWNAKKPKPRGPSFFNYFNEGAAAKALKSPDSIAALSEDFISV